MYLLSHSFCGSGIWAGLSGPFCLRVLQESSRVVVSSQSTLGEGSASKLSWIFQALCSFSLYKWGIQLLVDFQLGSPSVPCHMGVSNMTSKGKSLPSRWALQFYVIEWRKWHPHLCCVLLAKTSLRSQLEKRGDCTRAGDCVHHLRACPSQTTSLKLFVFLFLFQPFFLFRTTFSILNFIITSTFTDFQ